MTVNELNRQTVQETDSQGDKHRQAGYNVFES